MNCWIFARDVCGCAGRCGSFLESVESFLCGRLTVRQDRCPASWSIGFLNAHTLCSRRGVADVGDPGDGPGPRLDAGAGAEHVTVDVLGRRHAVERRADRVVVARTHPDPRLGGTPGRWQARGDSPGRVSHCRGRRRSGWPLPWSARPRPGPRPRSGGLPPRSRAGAPRRHRVINASRPSGVAFTARFARENQIAGAISLIPSATSGTGFLDNAYRPLTKLSRELPTLLRHDHHLLPSRTPRYEENLGEGM